ncbi:MAG: SGNH/GDSL hydrolase family protein [Clostridia bacterium]|nr:SGNH/GDSL hydrolase family protein [Clostridia bacterium]
MKAVWKKWIVAGIAALLTVGLLWAAQRLVMPKYQSSSIEGSLTEEYYRETLNHDVLFIGDCEVFSNFSPMTLYREYGIASYIRGSAQQLVWQSYALLEDALVTDSPSVVVFNVLALKYGEPQSEAYNRMTIDGMRWGKAKIDAIQSSMTDGEEAITYVFPLLRFHDRWSELTVEDFRCFFEKEPVSFSGYLLRTEVRPVTQTPTPAPLTDPHLPQTSMEWLEKLYTLCESHGIELVLVKSPSIVPHWYDEWDADIVAFANSHGIWYTNTIAQNDEIGIDYETDTCDMGQHLNVAGAEKLSSWFGAELLRRYDLPDRRTDDAYTAVWTEQIEQYERAKATE